MSEYKYKFEVTGRGGEIAIGTMSAETYAFWNEVDENYDEYEFSLADFCTGYDEYDVPDEHKFCEEGCWYDCDDIAHETGATLDDMSYITIYDENDQEVWQHDLDLNSLKDDNIKTTEGSSSDINTLEDGTCVFIGVDLQKGTFLGGEFTTNEPFDPSKLDIHYDNVDGWKLVTAITYDSEDLDSTEYETYGKGFDIQLIKIGE